MMEGTPAIAVTTCAPSSVNRPPHLVQEDGRDDAGGHAEQRRDPHLLEGPHDGVGQPPGLVHAGDGGLGHALQVLHEEVGADQVPSLHGDELDHEDEGHGQRHGPKSHDGRDEAVVGH